MKKNYRMISAAAAALLAVAPVASSVVSTVSAADAGTTNTVPNNSISVVPGSNTPDPNKTTDVNVSLSVTNAASLTAGSSVSSAQVTLTSSVGTASVSSAATDKVQAYEVKSDGTIDTTAVSTFEAGHTYVIKAPNVALHGLTGGAKYTVSGNATSTVQTATFSGDFPAPLNVTSSQFTIPDASQTGTPFFKEGTKTVTKGSVNYKDLTATQHNVAGIVALIKGKYTPSVSDGDTATIDWSKNGNTEALTAAVTAAVKAGNVTLDKDGNFTAAPANDLSFTVTATASNGKQASLPMSVKTTRPAVGDYSAYPKITFTGIDDVLQGPDAVVDITKADTATTPVDFNYVKIGDPVDVAKIQNEFHAQINTNDTTVLPVTVDVSKVNTKVAGSYPVTVSATNPNGFTTKVTFNLTVGKKGQKYSTVQYEANQSIPVYTINGNTVTASTTTIASGTQIAVFDTVTVGGKKYTRINDADSNQFVESQYVDGTYTPANKVNKTVMHASKVYDKTGKATGEHVKTYATVATYGDKIKLDDGNEAYRIGDNKYVRADNIDGHTVTLNHNSYIYKTSKKRTTFNGSKKLMKGNTVTVFGNPVTLKNGVKYYRIGTKKFIKAVNAD